MRTKLDIKIKWNKISRDKIKKIIKKIILKNSYKKMIMKLDTKIKWNKICKNKIEKKKNQLKKNIVSKTKNN